ncbi:hypothetical protein GOARA_082_00730 [Gordonia araii NBRC 100433]|uniref:DUF1772 domain-containing protein n=1 Tax=Gordonia araii NBRC 100433 TaxID=1073574 RepID=G7H759_9ACTN|nr:anthrone oxygenase family protein [Gordonia araii]NNG97680.1 DUF1772 domain-containing protein [Gordonia araii NBRC 100433]GAB11684.1 hypothetical protein GOARA_082_00730 [Gordonia araii NBRC 100433]
MRATLVVAAVLTSGLVAGLFAAFAYSVMPGLNRAQPTAAVEAMQRINTAILNPVFGLLFGGGLVVAILAAAVSWNDDLRWWAAGALACYVVGVLITMVLNVPLNYRLDRAGTPATGPEAATVWSEFAADWARWNIARAVVHLAGFGLLVVGLVTR